MTKVKFEEPNSKESDSKLRKSLQSLFREFHDENKTFSSSFSEYASAENEVKSENVEFGEAKNHPKKKNRFSNEFNTESKIRGSKRFSETNIQNQKTKFSTENIFPQNTNKFTNRHIIYNDNEAITGNSKNFNKTSIKFEKNTLSTKQDFPRKENESNKRENSVSVGNKSFIKYGTHHIFDDDDNSSSNAKSKNSPVKSIEKHNIKSVNDKSFKRGTYQIYNENDDDSSNTSKHKNRFLKGNKKNMKTVSDKDDNINKSFNNSSTSNTSKKRKFSLTSNNDENNTEKYGETNAKYSNQSKNNSSVDFPKKKRKRMKCTDANSFINGSFIKPEIDAEDPLTISKKSFIPKTSPKEGNKFHTNVLDRKSEGKKNVFQADFPRNKKNSNVSSNEKFVQSKVHKIDKSDKLFDSDDGEIESKKFEKEELYVIDRNPTLQSSKASKPKNSSEQELKKEKEKKIEENQCTLFVGNLPLSTTKQELKKIFSPFGDITSIRFAKGVPDGKKKWKMPSSSKYAAESLPGFVTFEQEQQASAALALNGTVFKDHHITVNLAASLGAKTHYDIKQTIFIGNLPFDVQDDNVWKAFSNCGKIVAVRLVRDKETGIGKSFGYVQFDSAEARNKALVLEELMVQGRVIRIKPVASNKKELKKLSTPFKRNDFKSKAIKLKRSNKNTSSRKTIKKLMNREKAARKKKKISVILRKAMK